MKKFLQPQKKLQNKDLQYSCSSLQTLMSHHHINGPIHFSNTLHRFCCIHSHCCHARTGNSGWCLPWMSNKPDRHKDYVCQMCHFSHSNLDSILTHIRKHLNIIVGWPVCSRGYQNVASLWKHGWDAHNIQIVAAITPLQGIIDPEEET